MAYLEYLRKSRADLEAEAHGEGETLARHRAALDELAARLHITIDATYQEIVSGDTIAARPQMQRLLREVEAGLWEGVLVMEVERLARGDTIDQGTVARAFKYSGTKIITPSKVYDPNNEFDEEYFEFSLFMSRREYKTIRRRLTLGVQAARKEGKFTGGAAPFGYEKYKLKGEKGGSLRPNADAPIVRDIFRWFLEEGLNIYQIAKRLNDRQVPRPNGGQWYHKTVSLILRNPHYAGYTTSARRPAVKSVVDGVLITRRPVSQAVTLYEGRHAPLISPDRWHEAQRRLADNPTPPVRRGHGQTNAFVGLLYCGQCGSRMQRNCFSGGRAPNLFCFQKACPTVSNRYDEVEALIQTGLHALLASYPVALDHEDETDTAVLTQELERLARESALLDQRAAKAYELVETGVYTPQEYSQRRAELCRQQEALRVQQSCVQAQIACAHHLNPIGSGLLPEALCVLDAYEKCENAAEQNALLKAVLGRIVYQKTEKASKWHESNLTLDLYPLLPALHPPTWNP